MWREGNDAARSFEAVEWEGSFGHPDQGLPIIATANSSIHPYYVHLPLRRTGLFERALNELENMLVYLGLCGVRRRSTTRNQFDWSNFTLSQIRPLFNVKAEQKHSSQTHTYLLTNTVHEIQQDSPNKSLTCSARGKHTAVVFQRLHGLPSNATSQTKVARETHKPSLYATHHKHTTQNHKT